MKRHSVVLTLALLIGLSLFGWQTPRASAVQLRRSVVRSIQLEQRRRDQQTRLQAERWRKEHERRLMEWKRWEQR